ncbi:hypothetical protein GALL_446720 [mine drainage metagenome]|uniref:Uncharacterized protein n=1 Tax=mine drainage metagenome TaxID=410659 RepID=A0A1J5PQB4_9ZZZZ
MMTQALFSMRQLTVKVSLLSAFLAFFLTALPANSFADTDMTDAELAIAKNVDVGLIACELGAVVTIMTDQQRPGYFDVQFKKLRFRMAPVIARTGAIRLEDAHAGAIWLQLSNKSMLISQKTGTRLADACMSPAQAVAAAAMQKNPPTSLLEPLPVQRQSASTFQGDAPF